MRRTATEVACRRKFNEAKLRGGARQMDADTMRAAEAFCRQLQKGRKRERGRREDARRRAGDGGDNDSETEAAITTTDTAITTTDIAEDSETEAAITTTDTAEDSDHDSDEVIDLVHTTTDTGDDSHDAVTRIESKHKHPNAKHTRFSDDSGDDYTVTEGGKHPNAKHTRFYDSDDSGDESAKGKAVPEAERLAALWGSRIAGQENLEQLANPSRQAKRSKRSGKKFSIARSEGRHPLRRLRTYREKRANAADGGGEEEWDEGDNYKTGQAKRLKRSGAAASCSGKPKPDCEREQPCMWLMREKGKQSLCRRRLSVSKEEREVHNQRKAAAAGKKAAAAAEKAKKAAAAAEKAKKAAAAAEKAEKKAAAKPGAKKPASKKASKPVHGEVVIVDHEAMKKYLRTKMGCKDTEKDITACKKRRRLNLHPDKNPNNPNAAADFAQWNRYNKLYEECVEEPRTKTFNACRDDINNIDGKQPEQEEVEADDASSENEEDNEALQAQLAVLKRQHERELQRQREKGS